MTGTFPPGGLVSPPLGTAVAGTDVACGGCCAYNDQPSAIVEKGLALATVPNGICPSRQGAGLVRAGTAPATPCGSLDLLASSSCACRMTWPAFGTEWEHPPAALPLVPRGYCGGRFSRTRGFSVAMRSPSATLSSGSSRKNVRTQLL